MNKLSIFFALMLIVSVCGAQTRQKTSKDMVRIKAIEQMATKSDYQKRLTSSRSDDNIEISNYYYDNYGRLQAVRDYMAGEYEVIDSVFYNNQGQLVKLSGWQKMGTTWKNVYYIDYTYDAAGNLASRTNYNNQDGWQMGGIYTYTYNDQHKIILTELTMTDILFQKIEYSYYADGSLRDELWYSYNGWGVQPDEKLTHIYENGRLISIQDSTSDNGGSSWNFNGEETFVYDQYGNTLEYHRYNRGGTETRRQVYEYEYNLPLSTTQIPWHPDLEHLDTYSNTHAYVTEHYWTVDVDWVLQYMCDYFYYYDDYVGIADRPQVELSVYPNPTTGRITVQAEQVKSISVYNTLGQVVKVYGQTNTIDLSDLGTGVYTLCVRTQNGSAVQQVVLQ